MSCSHVTKEDTEHAISATPTAFPTYTFDELFEDEFLIQAIATQLDKTPEDSVTIQMLASVNELFIEDSKITSLEGIEHLYNLKRLQISNCQKLKKLPYNFGQLKNLEVIVFERNAFSISFDIGNFINLKRLSLLGSSIDNIPFSIGKLTNLTYLSVYGSMVTEILSDIGDLQSLSKLNLSNNDLTEFPQFHTELPNLTKLDLSNNHLSQMPTLDKILSQLKKLNLSHNELTRVPSSIGNFSKLESLDLSYNKIEWLSNSIADLPLRYLNVGFNQFRSDYEVPESLKKKFNFTINTPH